MFAEGLIIRGLLEQRRPPRPRFRREKPFRQEQPAPCIKRAARSTIDRSCLLKPERTRLRRSSATGEGTPIAYPIVLQSSMLLLASGCSNQEPRELLPRPAGVVPNVPANSPERPRAAIGPR